MEEVINHRSVIPTVVWYLDELPDVQAGFRKGRGTRDQVAKSTGSSKKQESSRKNI